MRKQDNSSLQFVSSRYTSADWAALKLDETTPETEDWARAFAIFRDRIDGRFLAPADALIAAEARKTTGTFGFSILALDFLVVETVQGFRDGVLDHRGQSEGLFTSFLSSWSDFVACVPPDKETAVLAKALYKQGRCALHHSGATDRLRVRRSGSMLLFREDGRIELNRTKFHAQLRGEFDRYLHDLAGEGAVVLRKNFKNKMNHICGN